MAELNISTEIINDMILLSEFQKEMGISNVLDQVLIPHGNREGLSYGVLTSCWLTYIISESDHKMSLVELWASRRITTLRALFGDYVVDKDFTDDRLADILFQLSKDELWEEIEYNLNKNLIRVYNLSTNGCRFDATTFYAYRNFIGDLFKYGHSKDKRPDLPQVKLMASALDPLGMPLVINVTPGNSADDPLYIPAIKKTNKVLKKNGVLMVGDTKMSALKIRGYIQNIGNYYLTPLSMVGDNGKEFPNWVKNAVDGSQELIPIRSSGNIFEEEIEESCNSVEFEANEDDVIAKGYEFERTQGVEQDGKILSWTERVLVVRSSTFAEAGSRGLEKRIKNAMEKINNLTLVGRGRKVWRDLDELKHKVDSILAKHKVEGFITVTYSKKAEHKHIRKYGDRPERDEYQVRYFVSASRIETAIEEEKKLLGWRAYVTNAPIDAFSLEDIVLAYREQYRIERNFKRLKGSLGIRPVYVRRDDHTKGLIRLLSIALKILALIEYVVRRKLKQRGEEIYGLYPGNPKRSTSRPTTERILRTFKDITLTVVDMNEERTYHLNPFSNAQRDLLSLLGMPEIYERTFYQIPKSGLKMSER